MIKHKKGHCTEKPQREVSPIPFKGGEESRRGEIRTSSYEGSTKGEAAEGVMLPKN